MSHFKRTFISVAVFLGFIFICSFLVIKSALAAPRAPAIDGWAPPGGRLIEEAQNGSMIVRRYHSTNTMAQVSGYYRGINGLGGDPAFHGYSSKILKVIKRSSAKAGLSLGGSTNGEVVLSREKQGAIVAQAAALPNGAGAEVIVIGAGLVEKGQWTELRPKPYPGSENHSSGMTSGIKASRHKSKESWEVVLDHFRKESFPGPAKGKAGIYFSDRATGVQAVLVACDGEQGFMARYDGASLETIHIAAHLTNTFYVIARVGNPWARR